MSRLVSLSSRGHRRVIRPLRLLSAAIAVGASATTVRPQEATSARLRSEDLAVGGVEERYLRALAVLQAERSTSGVMRGEYAAVLRSHTAVGPWAIDTSRRRLSWRGGRLEMGENGAIPVPRDDGPSWSGRGLSARMSPVMGGQWGLIRYRLAPELWWTENRPFALVPAGPTPYSDPAKGGSIDLPQRFGPDALGRVDPGESHLAIEWRGLRLAATSGALRVGAGSEHTILLQGGQGGFPRLEAGIPSGFETPIGRLTGALGWGRLAQTRWAANRRAGARLGSYLVAAWTPPGDRVDLGVARFYHRDWAGIRAKDLLVPFGSLFTDEQSLGLDAADNQLAVLFARVRAPEAGLELFGEFGRNDRSSDARDVLVELEHNSAWLVGVQRVWHESRGALRSLTLSGASGRIPSVTRYRGQASFYEHSPLVQGHTMRGQALGTALLERDGGAELRMDWFDGAGARALVLTSRAMANRRAEAIAPGARRHEWGLWWEHHQWRPVGRVSARVGGVADLGRGPDERDAYGVHVSGSVTWLR